MTRSDTFYPITMLLRRTLNTLEVGIGKRKRLLIKNANLLVLHANYSFESRSGEAEKHPKDPISGYGSTYGNLD